MEHVVQLLLRLSILSVHDHMSAKVVIACRAQTAKSIIFPVLGNHRRGTFHAIENSDVIVIRVSCHWRLGVQYC